MDEREEWELMWKVPSRSGSKKPPGWKVPRSRKPSGVAGDSATFIDVVGCSRVCAMLWFAETIERVSMQCPLFLLFFVFCFLFLVFYFYFAGS